MLYLILGLPSGKFEAFESKELPASAFFTIPPLLPDKEPQLLLEVWELCIDVYWSEASLLSEVFQDRLMHLAVETEGL